VVKVADTQEAKYVERWPNTTSAWAGWSRFDIPVDRYGGVHSLLICTSSPLGSPTCHWASLPENTYWTKYQKADRASTLVTLWLTPPHPLWSYCTVPFQNTHTYVVATWREPRGSEYVGYLYKSSRVTYFILFIHSH
jgi:hypothetical protein